jgi:8-oxo-dGTP diphosphatase
MTEPSSGEIGSGSVECPERGETNDPIEAMPRPQTPLLAADTIIELTDRPGRPIVLIERRYPPHGWAIPGGFVDVGEPLEAAAVREALEETALQVTLRALLGLYSDPKRDPRGHTVTAAYVGEASGEPRAQDDARSLAVFHADALPEVLAFDHALVLSDYRRFRDTGEPAPLRHVLRGGDR